MTNFIRRIITIVVCSQFVGLCLSIVSRYIFRANFQLWPIISSLLLLLLLFCNLLVCAFRLWLQDWGWQIESGSAWQYNAFPIPNFYKYIIYIFSYTYIDDIPIPKYINYISSYAALTLHLYSYLWKYNTFYNFQL